MSSRVRPGWPVCLFGKRHSRCSSRPGFGRAASHPHRRSARTRDRPVCDLSCSIASEFQKTNSAVGLVGVLIAGSFRLPSPSTRWPARKTMKRITLELGGKSPTVNSGRCRHGAGDSVGHRCGLREQRTGLHRRHARPRATEAGSARWKSSRRRRSDRSGPVIRAIPQRRSADGQPEAMGSRSTLYPCRHR